MRTKQNNKPLPKNAAKFCRNNLYYNLNEERDEFFASESSPLL